MLFLNLSSAVSHLCEGSCKALNYIGRGLCNVLDVAIGFLKLTEMATAWVGSAINFVLSSLFRVYRLSIVLFESQIVHIVLNSFELKKRNVCVLGDETKTQISPLAK